MSEKMQVEAICNGSVIDHIPAGQGIKILKLFQLVETSERITVGFNLKSGQLGKKDLIKIENTRLTEEQANQLALFAPKATVNIIEEFEVVKKHQLELPAFIEGVFECPNSNCISHSEPVPTHFKVREVKGEVRMKCKYCEKSFTQDIVSALF
ncbi:aspartate carbamoyltransferase regulatory subunit [Aeromonas sp. RU39B]|jgi:aspartate carbamoyltransferase regulatory subunit|uniref:aspartate carbamoyltransferase regulatory subunit n=1 Tax=Aeromonas sp. RU39B TaxID=1907416 RepID=UPI000955565F|nr:aspartate carbamoyltransferase regulatory subunit [Aeromonas sp. RU39B]SIR60604.1 aspartate carbamoyltransferase regulatory subunit [Aeromonas sp. RU39B]